MTPAPEDDDPDLGPLAVEDLPPAPAGAPPDFRERLALHLKTTAPDVLRAAEADYRGRWPSAHHYIAAQVAEHLPPFLAWLPQHVEPGALRDAYEAGKLVVWTIGLPDGTCLVFESVRDEHPLRLIER